MRAAQQSRRMGLVRIGRTVVRHARGFRRRAERVLLSRRAALGVISVAASAILLSMLVSQAAAPASGGQGGFAGRPGLDQAVMTWWFLAVVAVAGLQLTLVTLRLAARDIRRLRRDRGPASTEPFPVEDMSGLSHALNRHGYLPLRRCEELSRWVRHPWGYLGPVALHAGMLLALLALLVSGSTRTTGVLSLAEGESRMAGERLGAASVGPLGAQPVLEETITLTALETTYWDTGEPRSIEGTYTLGEGRRARAFSVVVNGPVSIDGVRYFQEQRVGYAFFVTLERLGEVEQRRLHLPQPEDATTASYLDTPLPNGDMLRAKLLVDETANATPVLTLRLVRGGETVGETALSGAGTGMLGDTHVSIDFVRRWATVTLERSHGLGVLFASFFVIFLGAALIYLTPPRELTVVQGADGSLTAHWYAARFGTILGRERDDLRLAAAQEKGAEWRA